MSEEETPKKTYGNLITNDKNFVSEMEIVLNRNNIQYQICDYATNVKIIRVVKHE